MPHCFCGFVYSVVVWLGHAGFLSSNPVSPWIDTRVKIVFWKKGQTVADGPFAESKEAIGGYFLLRVGDLEEAVEIAKRSKYRSSRPSAIPKPSSPYQIAIWLFVSAVELFVRRGRAN